MWGLRGRWMQPWILPSVDILVSQLLLTWTFSVIQDFTTNILTLPIALTGKYIILMACRGPTVINQTWIQRLNVRKSPQPTSEWAVNRYLLHFFSALWKLLAESTFIVPWHNIVDKFHTLWFRHLNKMVEDTYTVVYYIVNREWFQTKLMYFNQCHGSSKVNTCTL